MATAKRTRLAPHHRRMQLLDCARSLIVDRGLSSFTMDALAKEAQVSHPLIYKYFATRLNLLQELLLRESKEIGNELEHQIAGASDYRAFIARVVEVNFEQFSDNNIINMLRGQPDVYDSLADIEKKRRRVMAKYLVKSLSGYLNVESMHAEQVLVLASGASQAAAAQYHRYGGNKTELIEATVLFILGGTKALQID